MDETADEKSSGTAPARRAGTAVPSAQAARAVLELILADRSDPATHGELVRFGQVLP